MKESEVDIFVRQIGQRVLVLRNELGITQKELAARADVDVRQIQRVENGHHSPSIKTMLKVANGLGIGFLELFDFKNR